MMKIRKSLVLIVILILAAILRFYNLMHDAPYFFNPDERNMANAITQFQLPSKLSEIPACLIGQIRQISKNSTTNHQLSTNNCNLNPHFFAYGQFPLYLSFASDLLTRGGLAILQGHPFQTTTNYQLTTAFSSAIFWLRFWSAVSSTLIVLLVYMITDMFINRHSGKSRCNRDASRIPLGSWTSQDDIFGLNIGHYAAIFAAFTPGLIQAAHFGTTESLLTFFFMASVYLSLRYLSNLSHLKFVFLNSLVIGLAIGSKLTGIFFLLPPLLTLIIRIIRVRKEYEKIFIIFITGILLIVGSVLFGVASSPYNLVEPESFRSAVFGYESDVAMGIYEAFYTRQFVNTTPLLFQAEKVFPYALGWPVFIIGTAGFLFMSISLISKLIQTIIQSIKYQVLRIRYKKEKNKNILNTYYLILTTSLLFYFLPNSFLFAKWIRFMTPIFPFFGIFAGYLAYVILGNSRIPLKTKDSGQARMTNKLGYWVVGLLVITSILPGIALMSIYTHEDSRVQASRWIYKNIPNNSYILSETANVIDIPLGLPSTTSHQPPATNYTVVSFDFYHLDENPLLFTKLLNHLEKADYIFIPSRRIFANYLRLPEKYPLVTKYYQLLFSGRLGYEKAVEISSFPQITIGQIGLISQIWNDENAEETYTVFDHPVVRIYKKVKPFTKDEYRSLFEK